MAASYHYGAEGALTFHPELQQAFMSSLQAHALQSGYSPVISTYENSKFAMIVYYAPDGSYVGKELLYYLENMPPALIRHFPQPQTLELLPEPRTCGHLQYQTDTCVPNHLYSDYPVGVNPQPCPQSTLGSQPQPSKKLQPHAGGQFQLWKQRTIQNPEARECNPPEQTDGIMVHQNVPQPIEVQLPLIAEMPVLAPDNVIE